MHIPFLTRSSRPVISIPRPTVDELFNQLTPIPYRALTEGELDRLRDLHGLLLHNETRLEQLWKSTLPQAQHTIATLASQEYLISSIRPFPLSSPLEGDYVTVGANIARDGKGVTVPVGIVGLWKEEGFSRHPVVVKYHVGAPYQVEAAQRFRDTLRAEGIPYREKNSRKKLTVI